VRVTFSLWERVGVRDKKKEEQAMKRQFYDDAMRLYVREQLSFESIAKLFSISERTLRNWAKNGNWYQKRDEFLKQNTALSDLHYQVSTLLLKRVLAHLQSADLNGKDGFDERIEKMIQAAARLSPQTERARKFEDFLKPKSEKNTISQEERLKLLQELGVITEESEVHHA
jgi:hypothetical protein